MTDAGTTGCTASACTNAFIIDDEDGICRFISMTLDTLGVRAQSYPSAQPAIEALDRAHPEIVFLDIELKGSDAVEVIRALGERRYDGTVQLMSGSGALLDEVWRIGARHGLNMRPALAKPFRADAIRQAIQAVPLALARPIRLGLDEALAKNWLELWYQPKIDLRTNSVAGAEGLIRCRHPSHGVLAPGSFLPDANEACLTALTEYVVVTALRDWDTLARAGINLRIAVNTSMAAFSHLNLPTLVREHRPKSQEWPGLILDIAQNEVKDVALVHEIATQLRIYGIALSIHDFGDCYASFGRLRELAIRELKLDASIVQRCAGDISKADICQSVIGLAQHFGAVAVAEGLDDTFDLAAIKDMGCDIGQGSLLALPMPKPEFISAIGERARTKQAWLT